MRSFYKLYADARGFFFINFLLILTLYFWMTNPLAYLLIGSGLVTIGYFIRRAICNLVGE